MSELIKLGIEPKSISFESNPNDAIVTDYVDQITTATTLAWGKYWPQRMNAAVQNSGLFLQIATTTTETASALRINKLPKLGLLNGFLLGKLNFFGYCWEDEAGETWVGLDEYFMDSIATAITHYAGSVPPRLSAQIKFVMAEEVFHAFVREKYPELTEASIEANAAGDAAHYWNNPVEKAAKEFARLYSGIERV